MKTRNIILSAAIMLLVACTVCAETTNPVLVESTGKSGLLYPGQSWTFQSRGGDLLLILSERELAVYDEGSLDFYSAMLRTKSELGESSERAQLDVRTDRCGAGNSTAAMGVVLFSASFGELHPSTAKQTRRISSIDGIPFSVHYSEDNKQMTITWGD